MVAMAYSDLWQNPREPGAPTPEPPEARHRYSRPGDGRWLVHLFHWWLCGVLCPFYTAPVLGLAKSGRFPSSHRFLISSRCVSEMSPCGISLGAHDGGSGSRHLLQSAYRTTPPPQVSLVRDLLLRKSSTRSGLGQGRAVGIWSKTDSD